MSKKVYTSNKPMKELQQLPKFTFSKGPALTAEEEAGIEAFIKSLTIDRTTGLPGVERVRNTWGFFRKMDELMLSHCEWAKSRLGLSLTKRFPDINKVHLIKGTRSAREAMGKNFGHHVLMSQEIVVIEEDQESETLFHLSHELTHAFSRSAYKVKRAEDKNGKGNIGVFTSQSGFCNIREKDIRFAFFNEMVTEAINIEIAEDQRKRGKEDMLTPGHAIAYAAGVLFLDRLIDGCAQKLGLEPEEIRKQLYTAYFKGDVQVLKLFTRAFPLEKGESFLKMLSTLNQKTHPVDLQRLLIKIGVDTFEEMEFVGKWNAYNLSKEIEILGGIKLVYKEKPTAA